MMKIVHDSFQHLEMSDDSPKHSRFYSYLSDQRPNRPQRILSPLEKSKTKKQISRSLPRLSIHEQSDEAPICPRRSLSPKRSSEGIPITVLCQKRLQTLLSYALGPQLADSCLDNLPRPNSLGKEDGRLSPSIMLETEQRRDRRESFTDEPPICPRRILSPTISLHDKTPACKQNYRDFSSSCRLDAFSIVSLPDIDLTDGRSHKSS